MSGKKNFFSLFIMINFAKASNERPQSQTELFQGQISQFLFHFILFRLINEQNVLLKFNIAVTMLSIGGPISFTF